MIAAFYKAFENKELADIVCSKLIMWDMKLSNARLIIFTDNSSWLSENDTIYQDAVDFGSRLHEIMDTNMMLYLEIKNNLLAEAKND
jgi:hypothetical protein